MTVGELIKSLQEFPTELPVHVYMDGQWIELSTPIRTYRQERYKKLYECVKIEGNSHVKA